MSKRNRSISSASETELANLTGIGRQSIQGILIAANVKPLSETVLSGGAVRRLWPRDIAVKALNDSPGSRSKRSRDRLAHARAELIEVQEGLRNGAYFPTDKLQSWIGRYLSAAHQHLRNLAGRHAHEIAAINGRGLPPLERNAAIRQLLQPTLDYIDSLKETIQ